MKNRNEALIIKNRGGKIIEVKLVSRHEKSQYKNFFVEGSMETKVLPEHLDQTMQWLIESEKKAEIEELMKCVFE